MPASRSAAKASAALPFLGLGLLWGLISVLLGLLPWLLSGPRLPLQNLEPEPTLRPRPLALLPLSQYEVLTLGSLLLTAGVLAGLSIRFWRPRHRTPALVGAILGVGLGLGAAAFQSFAVLSPLLRDQAATGLYLAGMSAGVIVLTVLAMVATALLGLRSRTTAGLGLGLSAYALSGWLTKLMVVAQVPDSWWIAISPWIAAVIAGLALAYAGAATAGRVVVWIVVLLWLWVCPALMSAVQIPLGSRAVARNADLAELFDFGTDVFISELAQPPHGPWPFLLAVSLGLVGWLLLLTVAKARGTQR